MIIAIVVKTLRDHWKSTLAWALGLVGMIGLELYIYPTVVKSSEAMKAYIDAFPDALKTIFRMQDYFSGAGFLGTELYSLMIPLIFVSVAASRGSSAIAGEEESGTADILYVMPISRTRILMSKIAAMTIEIFFFVTITIFSVVMGARAVDMKISTSAVVFATIAAGLMALIFGALALFAGSFTGKKGVATGFAVTIAIAALLFYTLAPMVTTFDSLTPYNPMDWAINGNPLSRGVSALSFAKLAMTAIAFSSGAILLFRKHDIRA